MIGYDRCRTSPTEPLLDEGQKIPSQLLVLDTIGRSGAAGLYMTGLGNIGGGTLGRVKGQAPAAICPSGYMGSKAYHVGEAKAVVRLYLC